MVRELTQIRCQVLRWVRKALGGELLVCIQFDEITGLYIGVTLGVYWGYIGELL